MSKFKVFVGWDQRDHYAYRALQKSLGAHSSIDTEIIPIKEWDLRQAGLYWRGYHTDGNGQMWDDRDGNPFSTQFSFTRFCVPLMNDFANEWVMFMDADMMFRGDIKELVDLIDTHKAMMCVQHDHAPTEKTKMDNIMQTRYKRKNWSSVMLMNTEKCWNLTKYAVNNSTGSFLHQMCWLRDDEIGTLPEEWNWLDGWSSPGTKAKIVHFTRGTPDMTGEHSSYGEEWWHYLANSVHLHTKDIMEHPNWVKPPKKVAI